MVPYNTKQRSTTSTMTISSTDVCSTADPNENYVWWDFMIFDPGILQDLPVLPTEEKPSFERVMKMRNTDGRPIKYSTWKPVRMLCGRDNIGVRNFKKMH